MWERNLSVTSARLRTVFGGKACDQRLDSRRAMNPAAIVTHDVVRIRVLAEYPGKGKSVTVRGRLGSSSTRKKRMVMMHIESSGALFRDWQLSDQREKILAIGILR